MSERRDRIEDVIRGVRPIITKMDLAATLGELSELRSVLDDTRKAAVIAVRKHLHMRFLAAGWRRLAIERIGLHEECEYARMHEANDAEDALLAEQYEHRKLREVAQKFLDAADSSNVFERLGEMQDVLNAYEKKQKESES